MRNLFVYGVFIAIVVGIGLYIGVSNPPGEWYQALTKPSFNPPNWLFPPVWTILYIIIGFVGARTFIHHRATHDRTLAMTFWFAQMILNFAWSPTFFGFHHIALGLAVIIGLLVCVVAFIATSRKQDGLSAALFLPYLAWVAFASLLNGSILVLN